MQSRTQSPQALWPAVSRQERNWGTEILPGVLLPQDFCGKRLQAVTRQASKKKIFFSNSPESLLATNRRPKSLRPLGTKLEGLLFCIPQLKLSDVSIDSALL